MNMLFQPTNNHILVKVNNKNYVSQICQLKCVFQLCQYNNGIL